MKTLCAYDYPGNVRELRNTIESSVIHCKHAGVLTPEDLPEFLGKSSAAGTDESWPMETLDFKDVEKRLYQEALSRTNNNVSAAARLLGLSRGKLRRRLADLGIDIGKA